MATPTCAQTNVSSATPRRIKYFTLHSGYPCILRVSAVVQGSRRADQERGRRREYPLVTTTADLWKPYKPSVFYYEVVECGRRISLAGVVVFIKPNTSAQIAVTLVMAFVFRGDIGRVGTVRVLVGCMAQSGASCGRVHEHVCCTPAEGERV